VLKSEKRRESASYLENKFSAVVLEDRSNVCVCYAQACVYELRDFTGKKYIDYPRSRFEIGQFY
jgi:hypothetical protein